MPRLDCLADHIEQLCLSLKTISTKFVLLVTTLMLQVDLGTTERALGSLLDSQIFHKVCALEKAHDRSAVDIARKVATNNLKNVIVPIPCEINHLHLEEQQ